MSLVLAQLLIQLAKPTVLEKVNTNVTAFINSSDLQMNDTSTLNTEDIVDLLRFVHYVWNDVFALATLLVFIVFISVQLAHHNILALNLLSARLRIACCSLIYRKVAQSKQKVI